MKKIIAINALLSTLLFCCLANAQGVSDLEMTCRFLISKDLGYASISPSGQFQGKLISKNDERVTKLESTIISLSKKFILEKTINGKKVPRYDSKADMIVALVTGAQQELNRYGVKEASFNLFNGMDQLPTKNSSSKISRYMSVYSLLRLKGVSHQKTINQMKSSLLETSLLH